MDSILSPTLCTEYLVTLRSTPYCLAFSGYTLLRRALSVPQLEAGNSVEFVSWVNLWPYLFFISEVVALRHCIQLNRVLTYIMDPAILRTPGVLSCYSSVRCACIVRVVRVPRADFSLIMLV